MQRKFARVGRPLLLVEREHECLPLLLELGEIVRSQNFAEGRQASVIVLRSCGKFAVKGSEEAFLLQAIAEIPRLGIVLVVTGA